MRYIPDIKGPLRHGDKPTCFPPPLLGGTIEEMEGPAGPPLLLFPVQLLQRISPWLPFFHIDEEFVLHTAQHGFKPSGIVNGRHTAPQCHEMNVKVTNNEMMVVRLASAKCASPVIHCRDPAYDINRENLIPLCDTSTLTDFLRV